MMPAIKGEMFTRFSSIITKQEQKGGGFRAKRQKIDSYWQKSSNPTWSNLTNDLYVLILIFSSLKFYCRHFISLQRAIKINSTVKNSTEIKYSVEKKKSTGCYKHPVSRGRGYIYIVMTDSHCYASEINTTL